MFHKGKRKIIKRIPGPSTISSVGFFYFRFLRRHYPTSAVVLTLSWACHLSRVGTRLPLRPLHGCHRRSICSLSSLSTLPLQKIHLMSPTLPSISPYVSLSLLDFRPLAVHTGGGEDKPHRSCVLRDHPGASPLTLPVCPLHFVRRVIGRRSSGQECGGIGRGGRCYPPPPIHTAHPPKWALTPASPTWETAGPFSPQFSPLPSPN